MVMNLPTMEKDLTTLPLITSKNSVLKHILEDGNCRTSLDNILDYLSLFLKAYKDVPKFSLSWAGNLAHDHTKALYQGDYSLYSFFRSNRKALEKSFLFFFGDHGPRWGEEVKAEGGSNPFLFVVLPKSLRHTKLHEQVKAEGGNNPFLFIVLPKSLRHTKLHEQVLKNSKELMTPHDLHATFKDILYYQPQSNFSETEFKEFKSNPRGSSLLRELRYNVRRTCTDQALIQKLGRFAAEQMNKQLRSYSFQPGCHQVTLGSVSLNGEE
ncbi:hypothetical protein ANCDUO_08603 [Ancylostoma duodenale]|uniref:Sulfatase N-terminal domain-containing protein n=1 Tax=Ancylostoma duodenale TaxID=51022 RepID=A0A0C2DF97_9BILA|nr:hypothetical protein ANCDUO_08603 [Ancylostoma duodenale]